MSLAGSNEKKFTKLIRDKLGFELDGKWVFKTLDSTASISVDNSINDADTQILFEIDSGNMSKLLVGQYTLLNILHPKPENTIFVVVHYYRNYSSIRTLENFRLVNKYNLDSSGIRFVVFNINEFKMFLCDCVSRNDFKNKIIDKAYNTRQYN